jgi:sodium/potassium-transporting ATPase subunit alpha
MITGESEPVDIAVTAADPNALEARNIVFNGSLVVDGGCLAVAIRTGDDTLIGNMVSLTADTGNCKGTLAADIDYFVKFLTLFSLLQAAAVFAGLLPLSPPISPALPLSPFSHQWVADAV